MTTFVFGNSHTGAIRQGLRRLGREDELRVFALGTGAREKQSFSARQGDAVAFTDDEYRASFRQATGLDALDGRHRWGLCMGTHNARIYRDRSWATSEPAAIARAGARPVSDAALDAIVAADQRHVRDFIAAVHEVAPDCFVVACPWPREDFAKGNDHGIRPEVVKHIDDRARALFSAWLDGRGIPLVEPPEGVATADGFLAPEFCAPDRPDGRKDPHHGNARYGALMAERILAFLGTP